MPKSKLPKHCFRVTPLTNHGATHLLVLITVLLLVAVAGTFSLVASHADSVNSQKASTTRKFRMHFKFYSQDNPSWANSGYPYIKGKGYPDSASISITGCGPASLAMVASSLSGRKTVTPKEIAERYGRRFHSTNGTESAIYPVFASDYGLVGTDLGKSLDAAARFMKNKNTLVVANTGPGLFTTEGHIIVFHKYINNKFKVADPKHPDKNRYFKKSQIYREGNIYQLTGFSRP